MPYELVAYGDVNDLSSLQNYQNSFMEGDRGYLDLQLAESSSDIVSFIANELNEILLNRIEGYQLETYPSLLRVHFKVGIAPLVIIAAAVAAVILLIGILVAWKLYKMSPAGVVTSVGWLVFVVGLASAAIIALLLTVRKYLV